MNIEKQRMDYAWAHRDDPKYMKELVSYFQQMASYFSHKFGINIYYADDYMSESLDQAQRALNNFNPDKSTTYSYFYKVMSNSFRYSLRRDARKRAKMPSMSSYEELANIAPDNAFGEAQIYDPQHEQEKSDKIVIGDNVYDREELTEIVSEGKRLARKALKISNETARSAFIREVEGDLLKKCVLEAIKQKQERDAKREKNGQ